MSELIVQIQSKKNKNLYRNNGQNLTNNNRSIDSEKYKERKNTLYASDKRIIY